MVGKLYLKPKEAWVFRVEMGSNFRDKLKNEDCEEGGCD